MPAAGFAVGRRIERGIIMAKTEEARAATLAGRIARAAAKCKRIPKNGYNAHFKFNYVTESDVLDHVRDIMADEGIAVIACGIDRDIGPVQKDEFQSGGKVKFRYIVQNTDNPDDSIEILAPAESMDSDDKGIWKAWSGAHKYVLLKLFHLSSGDEPDAHGVDIDRRAPAGVPAMGKVKAEKIKRGLTAANLTVDDACRKYEDAMGEPPPSKDLADWPDSCVAGMVEWLKRETATKAKPLSATDPAYWMKKGTDAMVAAHGDGDLTQYGDANDCWRSILARMEGDDDLSRAKAAWKCVEAGAYVWPTGAPK